MERLVYLNGEWWDRVSNTPDEVAKELGAEIEYTKILDDTLLGTFEEVSLITKDNRKPYSLREDHNTKILISLGKIEQMFCKEEGILAKFTEVNIKTIMQWIYEKGTE